MILIYLDCRELLLNNTKDVIQPVRNLNLSQCKERNMFDVLTLWCTKIYHCFDSENGPVQNN